MRIGQNKEANTPKGILMDENEKTALALMIGEAEAARRMIGNGARNLNIDELRAVALHFQDRGEMIETAYFVGMERGMEAERVRNGSGGSLDEADLNYFVISDYFTGTHTIRRIEAAYHDEEEAKAACCRLNRAEEVRAAKMGKRFCVPGSTYCVMTAQEYEDYKILMGQA